MSARRVLVVGAGKRVREAALPAFHRAADDFEVGAVYARRPREVAVDGRAYWIRPFGDLDAAALDGVDLVYVAVAKDAVPGVLARLGELEPGRRDLLIDTPVVRFKHFRHAARAAAFQNAWVAEDCVHLPWIAPIRAAVAAGAIGPVDGVLFHRSAYAYHGVALAKALLGAARVERGRRERMGAGEARRTLVLAGGGEAWITEPRDYARGSFCVLGGEGSIADYPIEGPEGPRNLRIGPELAADGDVVALRLDDDLHPFDAAERELLRGDPPELGLTARMDAMKRVGFLRLLRAIACGDGGYPLDTALEDTVVDYHLERLGRYRATALTDPRRPLARALLNLVTRLGG